MKAFKPKNYIKSTSITEKYECAICYYIAEKPYTCNGRCGKMFCYQCLSCIKRNRNQCPFRCSKPFELTECKAVQLQFSCPFDHIHCKDIITNLSQFEKHSEICNFLPQGWKQKQQNFNKYRCESGHDLFFLDESDLRELYGHNFFEAPVNSICSKCQDKGLCRTICPKCSTKDNYVLFCTNCRKPPCTKFTCLYSHKLTERMNYGSGLFCDFCGISAHLLGPRVFRDFDCNFDICQSCFINLPETHELVPFTMSKDVIKHLKKDQQPQHQPHPFFASFGINLAARMAQQYNDYQVQQQDQPDQQEYDPDQIDHMLIQNQSPLLPQSESQHQQQNHDESQQQQSQEDQHSQDSLEQQNQQDYHHQIAVELGQDIEAQDIINNGYIQGDMGHSQDEHFSEPDIIDQDQFYEIQAGGYDEDEPDIDNDDD